MNIKQFLVDIPKWKIFALLIMMAVAGFDGIVLSQVMSTVTRFNNQSSTEDLISLVIYSLSVYLVIQVANLLVDIINNNILCELNKKYKSQVLKSLYSSKKIKKNSGDAISLLTVDLKLIEENYFAVILGILFYLIMGGISLGYLIFLNPLVSVLFIITSFLPTIPLIIFNSYLEKATEINLNENNKFIKALNDLFQGYFEVRTYNAFPIFFNRTNKVINSVEKSSEHLRDKHSFVQFVTSMLSWIGYILPISIALLFVVQGKLESSVVIALFLASDRVVTPFRNCLEYIRMINSTSETRKKIQDLLSEYYDDVTEDVLSELEQPDILINKLNFSYVEPIFSDVSLTIPFGSKILITGPSGCGKTTFLNLLQGTSLPDEGEIIFKDKRTGKESKLHKVARIYQEPYCFDLSLKENILMGLESSKKIDLRLREIISKLGLFKELGDDCLDKIFGEDLSGGQKQRIEIARALIHNRKIILIDEGTSSLDKVTAYQIRKLISEASSTIIEIAHHYDENSIQEFYTHRFEIKENKVLEVIAD